MAELSQKILREWLHYNPDTGIFTWKVKRAWNAQAGSVAGTIHQEGYVLIGMTINSVERKYLAHRLAFLYMTGEMPEFVDHINRNPADNRWENLRPATKSENGGNANRRVDNTSGYTGVSWLKVNNKWVVQINHKRKKYYLGLFDCEHIAARAWNKKAIELRGEYANLNIIVEK